MIASQPVSDTRTQLLHTLHPANTGGEFQTKKAGICGLVGKSPDGCKPLIDRASSTGDLPLNDQRRLRLAVRMSSCCRKVPGFRIG